MLRGRKVKHEGVHDAVLAGLLRESPTAKRALAKRLQQDAGGPGTTIAFQEIYSIGHGAANGITAVVLDPSAWSNEEVRETCEQDVFQLCLAKLMEVGHDHEGRAMKGVARLMAVDALKLHEFLDEDTFDVILATLDYRNSVELKSQATLATAKYLEVAEAAGSSALTNFVTSKVKSGTNEDLVMAFSAAAAVFPVATSVAAALFLVEGFLTSLIPLLEKKAQSAKVEHAALEMLSAACLDTACCDAIRKNCRSWLQHILETGSDERSGLAAVILAKLANPSLKDESDTSQYEIRLGNLVTRLQDMLKHESRADKQGAIEGLAYASASPKVKEGLTNDPDFLREILQNLSSSKHDPIIAFGCLTLLNNLSRYPPKMSEEQKRMSQLKAYANASKEATEPDPLDQEPAVKQRCVTLVENSAVSAIVAVGKSLSPASITLAFGILLSLSWPQSNRGTIAQQGGVKLLLQLYTRLTSTAPESIRARHTAAHALARILTSIDPALVFPASGNPSIMASVRPIVSLLTEDPALGDEGPRDLLPTFEALLALANLLVAPVSGVADLLIRLALTKIEELLLHDNAGLRRASTQVMTNLTQHPVGTALFSDGSDPAARRLYVLLALSGSEDLETRKAAGGALAMLTESEGVAKAILNLERGPYLLLAMLEDTEADVLYRGVVCVANLALADGPTGELARSKLNDLGLGAKLDSIQKTSHSDEISGIVTQIIQGSQDQNQKTT